MDVGNGIELENPPANDELEPPETFDEGKLPVPTGYDEYTGDVPVAVMILDFVFE